MGEYGIPGDTVAGLTRFEQVMEARRLSYPTVVAGDCSKVIRCLGPHLGCAACACSQSISTSPRNMTFNGSR